MTTSLMTTTIARDNDTSMTFTLEDSPSWRPLAIALPVCLIGIPLITVLIIVLFTCYRSKFRHKEISVFGRKLNNESRDQNEAADVVNEAGGSQTDNPTPLTTVYANLSETVEEARGKEAMGDSTSNGISRSLHWPLKKPWKRRKHGEAVNVAENTEVEKDAATDVTDHKQRGEEETKTEAGMAKEAKTNGIGMDRTPGRTTAETTGIGNLLRPKTNGQLPGSHGVPMRLKNETTRKNQYTDIATTTTTTTTTTKPSQTENRKTFVVMYSMDADEANHLSLDVNDVIFFMEEEKDGWMKGEKKETGEIGWFPRTIVREGMSPLVKKPHSLVEKANVSSETDNKATTAAARTTMAAMMTSPTMTASDNDTDAFEDFDDDDDDDDDYETGIEYQALYPYRATEDGDINFEAGDVIVVVEKQDNGWWRGYHGDDHGFFPGSYVQILRTDESNQSLPQAVGDSRHTVGDASQLDDPEMLLTVSEEEEVDDDDDVLRQNRNKSKMKSARRSIGVFLMSLPRRIATSSNRTGTDGGHGGGSPVVTSDLSTDPIKAKKTDRVVIPGVTKKKNKNKNKKTKNARGQRPSARRSSLAPGPPQSGPQGAAVGTLVKNVMSGLAHLVAAEAQLRSDPLDTTYEEIGTTDLFSATEASQSNPSEGNDALLDEIVRTLNRSDVMADGKTSTKESLVFDAKRNDVINGSSSEATAGTYSNLDFVVQPTAAVAKDGINRRVGLQETKNTEDNKQQRELKNNEQSKQLGPSPWKPVPPQKPRYIGSTPNIHELLSAIERRNDEGVRRSPGNRPRTLAKPGRPKSGRGHASDLGLAGADLRWALPPSSQKPKPLTEKPRYLSPGFPQGVAPQSDHQQMRRRDIYRSLDSILVVDDGTTDEDEAGGELEIMKWLRKKLSVEDELIGRDSVGVGRAGEKGGGGAQLNGGGKELQEMQVGRTMDILNGTTQNSESKDGARIVIMFESLSKAGLNEESFV